MVKNDLRRRLKVEDLHATCQLHLRGPMTHCQMGVPDPSGEREILGVKPPAKTCSCVQLRKKRWLTIHQVAASISNSVSYQITLVLLLIHTTRCIKRTYRRVACSRVFPSGLVSGRRRQPPTHARTLHTHRTLGTLPADSADTATAAAAAAIVAIGLMA